MADKPLLKRLLDAGLQFTEMSQANAEKAVGDFVKVGEVRRKDAEKTVQQLVDRGRAAGEQLLQIVQSEVAKQLGRFAERVDDLEDRIEEIAGRVGLTSAIRKAAPLVERAADAVAGKPAAPPAEQAATTAAAKKTAAKKTAAKKTAPNKTAPNKTAPTKAAAKKAAAKQTTTPAKKATVSSGVGKVAGRRPAAKRAATR